MCLNEPILIRLAAGEGSDEQLRQWRAHVQACERCAERYAAVRQTWDAMSAWQVTPPQNSLVGAVLAAAAAPARPAGAGWGGRIALAAAVAIAVGAGWTVGQLTNTPARPASVAVSTDPPQSPQEAAAILGLDQLAEGGLLGQLFAELPVGGPTQPTGDPS